MKRSLLPLLSLVCTVWAGTLAAAAPGSPPASQPATAPDPRDGPSREKGSTLKPIEGKLKVVGGRTAIVYKTTPQGALKINLLLPKDWKEDDTRAGIVFFFAGGDDPIGQFKVKCEYLASRGMVAAAPEYRTKTRHRTKPEQSIEDARSVLRWMRINAKRLGPDPGRIAAGGGSAGARLATIPAYNATNWCDLESEDQSISSKPDALVLYYGGSPFGPVLPDWPLGSNFKVTPKGPPAVLFVGTKEGGFKNCVQFIEDLVAAGTRAELYTAKDQGHGFCGAGHGGWQDLALYYTDRFLASLGYLKGEPTIALPADKSLTLTKEVPRATESPANR